MEPAVVVAVRRAGGVARTRELTKTGVRGRELTRAVAQGALVSPRRGIYALPTVSSAVVESLGHRGAIACVTASRDYGLWTLDTGPDESVHTWVDPDHHAVRVAIDPEDTERRCCVFHRDIPVDPPGLHRVGLVHCLLQILGCRGPEPFFTALESALRQGMLTEAQRAVLHASVTLDHRWLVDFARSDADSGLESLVRLRLHRRGITLASQIAIPGVGRVDFVLGDCLILEADGGTHDGEGRHRDRVRDAVAMTLGFTTMRFDTAMILHEWELVEAAVLAAVARNLHRSPAGLTW